MSPRTLIRYVSIALLAVGLAGAAQAQKPAQPSASSIALAKNLLQLKGSMNMLNPVVTGVIVTTKNMFLQTNFNLGKELNEVAAQIQKELEPRREVLINDIARMYAQRFTEQEIKDTIAFFNTPLGKKLLEQEPLFVESSLQYAQDWADKLQQEVMGKFRAEMKKRGKEI